MGTLSAINFASGECFAQGRLPTRSESSGDFGFRHEEVEPVVSTRRDHEFRCDSGMDQPASVLHVFLDEQVNGTYADPRRRQAGYATNACRDGCCRYPRRARRNTEQRAPGKTIGTSGPQKVANGGRHRAATARSVIEFGVDEQLEKDGDFGKVARVDRKP